MNQRSLRTFIAIELDQGLQKILKGIQDDLRKTGADVKWVESHNIHLTLKFLGDVNEEKILSLGETMESSLRGYPAFSFDLNHLGAFPTVNSPKIVWVGVGSGGKEIGGLIRILEDNSETVGFKKEERGGSPHVTIGRVRSSLNKFALSKMMKSYSLPQPMTQNVKGVVLFKSTLTSSGPSYEALKKFPLAF